MDYRLLSVIIVLLRISGSHTAITQDEPPDISLDWIEEPPEGYYAFIESPNAEPPRVRRPPYVQSDIECPGLKKSVKIHPNHRALSLCGDLNKGYVPKNPMMQNILGHSYPFELIKNKTLQFFSKTLPILKADETLPKVAKYKYLEDEENSIAGQNNRIKREVKEEEQDEQTEVEVEPTKEVETPEETSNMTISSKRQSRKLCDNNDGVLCVLYKALLGDTMVALGNGFERRDDTNDLPEYRRGEQTLPPSRENALPPTPCPAKVEYATPVFARNYQGVWRYVVQIPYEGYFTQTIEVTRCLNSRCHYMEGGCMSSPRWTSILVAEIFYPDTFLPSKPKSSLTPASEWPTQTHRQPVSADGPPNVQDFQNYQQYLQKRAGTVGEEAGNDTTAAGDSKKASHCDGVDEIGCFQVRLYYDWFLVPGSCKCWRPDYFSRYMRRKVPGPSEL